MTPSDCFCPVSGETPREERVNYLTHLVGLILSLMGWVFLMWSTYKAGDTTHLISCLVYGGTLVMLYGASTYYHACQTLLHKRVMRFVDHACIYLFIAGSYTPFALGPLQGSSGWTWLYVEWSIAFCGILFKMFTVERFKVISVIAYVAMGWLVLFSLPTLIQEMPFAAVLWLIAGGVSYTVGTIFYMWDTLPFNHGIWHLFVLGGSGCHFVSICHIVTPALIL